jgi:type VI secretion system secreted protein Hcp
MTQQSNLSRERGMSMHIFLEIDGITGESTDNRHKDQIELLSWSWGASNTTSAGSGGSGAGKVQFQPFVFTHRYDKASPKLMLACASGRHFPKAVLHESKPGGNPGDFLMIRFDEIFINAVMPGDQGQGPTEMVTLTANKIHVEYKPQKPDGSFDTAVTMGWDIKSNQAI